MLQRAVTMVSERCTEQDFLPTSYGIDLGSERCTRYGLAAGAAGHGWRMVGGGHPVVLRQDGPPTPEKLSRSAVVDGVIRRMIDQMAQAGVMEQGRIHFPEDGSPQGG